MATKAVSSNRNIIVNPGIDLESSSGTVCPTTRI